MTLLQRTTDLLLQLIGKILVAVDDSVILLLTITTFLINSLVQVADELWGNAAPLRHQLDRSLLEQEKVCSPVSPHKSLDTLSIDPGPETQLALGDLGFGVFAFFVLTAGAAGGGFLYA